MNDADDMAARLAGLGFQVTKLTDANQQEMEDAINAFGRKLQGGGVGLFFFAGHGVQVGRIQLPDSRRRQHRHRRGREIFRGQRQPGPEQDAGRRNPPSTWFSWTPAETTPFPEGSAPPCRASPPWTPPEARWSPTPPRRGMSRPTAAAETACSPKPARTDGKAGS